MPRPSHVVIAALTGSIASSASSQPLSDDFESYDVGSLPGTPWQDISTRIDNPTIPAPTASVINTTGADGSPTRAVQIVDERGTSSGIFADIQPADHHVFRMDVRIDQFSDVQGAWPGGIGLLQDENAADFNGDPQAVLYAWQDRRWHLFIKNSPAGAPNRSFDLLLAGLPRINVGRWYTLELEVDTQAGAFNASVFNGETGELIGEDSHVFTNWDPAYGQYDAISAFDGDTGAGGSFGGVSTYDNLTYIPASSTAIFAAVSAAMAAVRRR